MDEGSKLKRNAMHTVESHGCTRHSQRHTRVSMFDEREKERENEQVKASIRPISNY